MTRSKKQKQKPEFGHAYDLFAHTLEDRKMKTLALELYAIATGDNKPNEKQRAIDTIMRWRFGAPAEPPPPKDKVQPLRIIEMRRQPKLPQMPDDDDEEESTVDEEQ